MAAGPQKLPIGQQAINQNVPGASATSLSDPGQGLANIIGTILQGVMIIALLMVLYFLIMGAIEWITSAGDKGKLEAARNKMMNAVIGVLILSGTLAIFIALQYFLNVTVFNFSFSGSSSNQNPNQSQSYFCSTTGQTGICPAGSSVANSSACGTSCHPPGTCCQSNPSFFCSSTGQTGSCPSGSSVANSSSCGTSCKPPDTCCQR